MNKVVTILIINFLFINLSFTQNSGDLIFNNNVLHEIRITTEDPMLFEKLDNLWLEEFENQQKTYKMVDVNIDGTLLQNIGIRIKGGITGLDAKKPLKLDFNYFNDGGKYDGINKINLHQGWLEKSYVREMLSYNILRTAGVKSSRTSPAKVYLNNQYIGFYTLVEQINNGFINSNFGNKSGVLIKKAQSSYFLKSEEGSVEDILNILDYILTIPVDALNDSIGKYLDIESFLKYFAIEVLVSASDDIIDVDKDYYIYLEPKTKQLIYIPWDLNATFYFAKHDLGEYNGNIIFNHIIQNDILKKQYLEYTCNILLTNYTESRLFNIIDNYRDLIFDAVLEDPFVNTMEEISTVKEIIQERIATNSEVLLDRFIECIVDSSKKEFLVINELMTSNDSTSTISDPAGAYPDWIELYNNSNEDIPLSSYYLSRDKDFFKFWRFNENDTIKSNDYFIIWADKDLDEVGTHCNFKLKKQKGQVFLTNKYNVIIDSLSYSSQETNISFARFPNGIGDFRKQEPTFSASNDIVGIKTTFKTNNLIVYPNPISPNRSLNISTGNLPSKEYELTLYNIESIVIVEKNIITNNHDNISIDIPNIPLGPYFLVLKSSDHIFRNKVIVY